MEYWGYLCLVWPINFFKKCLEQPTTYCCHQSYWYDQWMQDLGQMTWSPCLSFLTCEVGVLTAPTFLWGCSGKCSAHNQGSSWKIELINYWEKCSSQSMKVLVSLVLTHLCSFIKIKILNNFHKKKSSSKTSWTLILPEGQCWMLRLITVCSFFFFLSLLTFKGLFNDLS